MRLYRISKTKRVRELSGEGARLYGGRWNEKGTPVLYFSDSTALATLETIVHSPLNIIPKNRSIITVELPDNLTTTSIETKNLPESWWKNPAPVELANIGSRWAKSNQSVALVVPSSITPYSEGRNYILNPLHPDFEQIKIISVSKYDYDNRLFVAKADAEAYLDAEELSRLGDYFSKANQRVIASNHRCCQLNGSEYEIIKR